MFCLGQGDFCFKEIRNARLNYTVRITLELQKKKKETHVKQCSVMQFVATILYRPTASLVVKKEKKR